MTKGMEIRCITDQDMLEIMRYICERGGEVICKDWEMRVLKVIRGTKDEKTTVCAHGLDGEITELFSFDGVLGAVNTDTSESGESDSEGRSELLRGTEGNLVQPAHGPDIQEGRSEIRFAP